MENLRKLQNIFNATPCGRDLVIYVPNVYRGRYFIDAMSSFYINSWQVESYRCGFSLDNLVRTQIIQIVVNSLRSVLKWTTILMNVVACSCNW